MKKCSPFLVLLAIVLMASCSSPLAPVSPDDNFGLEPAKAVQTESAVDMLKAPGMTSADAYENDDTQATAKTITSDGVLQEHNFYDDATDWQKFAAVSGTTYTIETWVFGTADTIVTVYDGSTSKASNDDKGDGTYGSKLSFTATATKTYTIRTRSYNSNYGTNRGYTLSVSGGSVTPPGVTLPQPQKNWTVLVYIAGDNNLSSYIQANVNQMQAVGSTAAGLNIVVLWDNGTSSRGYYYVQNGSSTLVQSLANPDTGSVSTAQNFIDYAATNFPADKYMWVYWNHGGAVDRSRGVCWDDTTGNHLSEANQKTIMNYGVSKFGKPFEVVGFDACLMATAEIYYQYRTTAKFMAASEQTEPGAGWDYTALQVIKENPAVSGDAVVKSVCSKYATLTNAGTSDWTFCATDLSYADELGAAVNDFATAAMASGSQYAATFDSLAGGLTSFSGYTKDVVNYMNVVIASATLPQTVKDKAEALKSVILDDIVIQEQHGSTWNNKAYGCSLTMLPDTTVYSTHDLCVDTQWDEFCTWAGF